DTMKLAREEDPDLQALASVLEALSMAIGLGPAKARTAATLLEMAGREHPERGGREYPALHEAIEGLGAMNSKRLGKWLSSHKGRIVGNRRLLSDRKGDRALLWYVDKVDETGLGGLDGFIPAPLREMADG